LSAQDIEYLGRMDDQVKVRGFRIEPGEIESVLRQHGSVRQALVVAREDKPGDQRLVAYLVIEKPAPLVEELRHLLKAQLPAYMIPATFVFLEKLPLTSNGKIDRRALPAPGTKAEEGTIGFVAPRLKLERIVAGLWRELLGVEQVGLHDNFFDMGGHSLLLVQLHYRLQAVLNRPVPITMLFQYPTLSALTKYLSGPSSLPQRTGPRRSQRVPQLQELAV
jgi:hypothetical protein